MRLYGQPLSRKCALACAHLCSRLSWLGAALCDDQLPAEWARLLNTRWCGGGCVQDVLRPERAPASHAARLHAAPSRRLCRLAIGFAACLLMTAGDSAGCAPWLSGGRSLRALAPVRTRAVHARAGMQKAGRFSFLRYGCARGGAAQLAPFFHRLAAALAARPPWLVLDGLLQRRLCCARCHAACPKIAGACAAHTAQAAMMGHRACVFPAAQA